VEPIEIYDRGRGPELKRIRITVYDLIPYLEAGWSHDDITVVLPITRDEVMALVRYIEEHKDEVMAHHRKIEERIARGNPPEIEERMRSSPYHAKLQARLAETQARSKPEENGEWAKEVLARLKEANRAGDPERQ
jgi:uncharacterized protein (DUF433 family)